MDYNEKISYAINFIITGLSPEHAFLLAGMTQPEIDKCRTDSAFNDQLSHELHTEHVRLRTLLRKTIERNARDKNDWRGVKTLLEITFPDIYHRRAQNEDSVEESFTMDDNDRCL